MAAEDITPEQVQEIYARRIAPTYFSTPPTPGQQKTLVLLGAQSGAGKSTATVMLAERYPGIVSITGDDLRTFHPRYKELTGTGGPDAEPILAQATSQWLRMAIDQARRDGHSLQLEGTFHTPSVAFDTARRFAADGYQVDVHILAVARRDSLLSAAERYLQEHATSGRGRWVTLENHDRGYAGTAALASQIDRDGPVDELHIHTRTQDDLYVSRRPDHNAAQAVAALEEGRGAAITNRTGASWISELGSMSRYALANGQVNPTTAPSLLALHDIALKEVVPALKLPNDSEATARVTGRLEETMQTIRDATATPAPAAAETGPAISPQTPDAGRSLH